MGRLALILAVLLAAELHEHRRVTLCETFGALTLETITPGEPA